MAEPTQPIGTGIVVAAIAPLLQEPRIASQQISQRLAGARVEILEEIGDWVRVCGEDGYEGWTHHGYLTRDASARPPERLSLGCIVKGADGMVRPLPLGARVADDLTIVDGEAITEAERARRFPARVEAICDSAVRLFEGTSYQWGGLTPWGSDCSGFVQSIFALHGVGLPRDAWQQSLLGRSAGRDILALGLADLLFFSDRDDQWITHVGLSLGARRMAHVALGRGGYALEQLDEPNDPYVRKLRERFLFGRRVPLLPERSEAAQRPNAVEGPPGHAVGTRSSTA
jgi:gamma-D-glutamyl-L-lysine dipeptidyl-peptidase